MRGRVGEVLWWRWSWTEEERRRRGAVEALEDGGVDHGVFIRREASSRALEECRGCSCRELEEWRGCSRRELEEWRGCSMYMGDIAIADASCGSLLAKCVV